MNMIMTSQMPERGSEWSESYARRGPHWLQSQSWSHLIDNFESRSPERAGPDRIARTSSWLRNRETAEEGE